jgi:1,2-dihydroxy-3-keto-5-methylthiopentene dioxygenase
MSEEEAKVESAPEPKKSKMSTEQSPDSVWPEAWILTEGEIEDQKAENRQNPNAAVSVEDLRALGIAYWKMDADSYEYPLKSVPWDPKDATDPRLKAIRDDRGYSYADIISIHRDHLPEYDQKIKFFFEVGRFMKKDDLCEDNVIVVISI